MSERKETYSLDWSMRVEIGSELDLLLRKCSPNDIPKAKNTSHKHFFICDDLDWANIRLEEKLNHGEIQTTQRSIMRRNGRNENV